MSYSDSIYSPDTAGTAAADQALVLRQQEHQQMIQEFHRHRAAQDAEIERRKQELEKQRQENLKKAAENWAREDRLRSEREDLQHNFALVKRDKAALAQRNQDLEVREDLRRRNRTVSAAFIEDSFATLSPRSVIEHLTHSSPRVRKHVMDNISSCINGFRNATPPLVRFKPDEIAPFLLPKLHQLVSVLPKPIDSVMQFAEDVVSCPPMAKALALSGDCPRLADYLIQANDFVNRLAMSSLRQMIRSETIVVKAAYDALAMAVPNIPLPRSPSDPIHPAVAFIEEMAPKIISDCFNNGLWNAISPLATHRINSIQRVVLPKIIFEAQHSDRTRHGLVEANTLALLDQQYQLPSPPPAVIDFFIGLLPLLAEKLCRRIDHVLWLLRRLSDPNPKINAAVVEAIRICSIKEDITIQDVFVKAELVRKLDAPPTQPSFAVTRLICELLPILAIPHARKRKVSLLIEFLDHSEVSVSNACLSACAKIVDSTVENRAHLYSVFSKLNFSKESTLKLCDYAMPVFCKDWAASGDFSKIAKILSHPERRMRFAAHRVWLDVISSTPSARSKIIRDDLLGVIFELCSSPYEDCLVLGYQTLPHMAVELAKAGTGPTRQLVSLVNHPRKELRKAVLQGIQVISESSNANCEVLLSADAFNALTLALEINPHDCLDVAHKLLVRLGPFLSKSPEACSGLLKLLDSKVLQVVSAARAALASIAYTNIEYRETLRTVILDRLLLASDALIEFTVQAIQDWIGSDLAQLNDFVTFFDLVSHSDRRIQTGALSSLKQRLSNRECQESLERANIIHLLRSLASNGSSPEAISFVTFALPTLSLTLASNGHVDAILQLLTSEEPEIRRGASAAVESIANGSAHERNYLLAHDILERLIGSNEQIGQTELQLSSAIIPKLAFDYLRAGRVTLIVSLTDHPQQHIRIAAIRSVTNIVAGTPDDRTSLRHALLPRLIGASAVLRDVASNCLSRAIAHDLVVEGDYVQLFCLLDNDDPRIRAPIVTELQKHIQASDEVVRRRIVDADILPATLAAVNGRDDLILFTADCVLQILGPSFSHNDGGASLLPLLNHNEPRIRTAAAIALRSGIDSRHGNVKNMAQTGMVLTLYSMMNDNDAIRDLWCHLLPKAAPFLSVRAEIDILFENLGDHRDVVRHSAAEAISSMARTSEETRLNLFPSLMHQLEDAPSFALESIAQAVSLSGLTFVTNSKEAELLYIAERGDPILAEAAVEAIIQLLSKGSSYEHKKLMDSQVFQMAMRLHQDPLQRQFSLKLLHSIIPHLSHTIVLVDDLAEHLFSLFDDPDHTLSQALYQTLASDPRISESSTTPEILPMLLEADRVRNPSVSSLLRHWAPDMVPRLIGTRRVNIIVRALMVKETTIVTTYLQEVLISSQDAVEQEKDRLVDEPQFVRLLGVYLKSREVALRRISSQIVNVLSTGSPVRSGRMMMEGIGSSLAWISVNGEKGAQQASIHALSTLFLAAPDHADQLVSDSLPALCDILEDVHRSTEVYINSLSLLAEISQQSPHSMIIESGVVKCLVDWLSPQHSVTNIKCRHFIFQICHVIAQNSDPGREALINDGVLPVLMRLANDHIGANVIHSCIILNGLAHTGTYRNQLVTAGVKDAMQQITSPIRKSTLSNKSEKKQAQDGAKQVLQTLKKTKHVSPVVIDSPTLPKLSLRSRNSVAALVTQRMPMARSSSDNSRNLGHSVSQQHLRRSQTVSESAGDLDALDEDDNFVSGGNRRRQTAPPPRPSSHVRASTDPDAGVLRAPLSRLSEAPEDFERNDEPLRADFDPRVGVSDLERNPEGAVYVRSSVRRRVSIARDMSETQRSTQFDERSGAGGIQRDFERDAPGPSDRRRSLPPPSYRTDPSASGISRRGYLTK